MNAKCKFLLILVIGGCMYLSREMLTSVLMTLDKRFKIEICLEICVFNTLKHQKVTFST